jgi:hypothetical protein
LAKRHCLDQIRVQAGPWELFIDCNSGGNTMRLTTGTNPTLTPDWDTKISSFMCLAPGPGA